LVHVLQELCVIAFCVLIFLPGFYGFHLLILGLLTRRRRMAVLAEQATRREQYRATVPDVSWPVVTTQIPLYNELVVARRVMRAVAAMDYPLGKHEIQVLDDSTDGTRELVDRVADELRSAGHDVQVVRRPTREHFKAGALSHGLRHARGELIAIFDADFVPPPDFLRRMVPLIASHPDAGCVQGRWGHLNASETWFTDAQSVGIDGHFGIEQPGRAWSGLLLNFNGTAGIWRREAIEDRRVGGWQGDTITEDLDLSYRAQIAGWKMLYCPDVVAPAEIPADVSALKVQQTRWATGQIQTARKVLPLLWRSDLSFFQKLEGTIHLTQYFVNVFMLVAILFGRMFLLALPGERWAGVLSCVWVPCALAAAASWSAYMYGRWQLGGGLVGPLRLLRLITLGLGLSLTNTLAILAGMVRSGGEFVRTPKSGAGGARTGAAAPYTALRSRLWVLEIVAGISCLGQWLWFLRADGYFGGTFLLLGGIGMLMLGWGSRPVGWPARWVPAWSSTAPVGRRTTSEPSVDSTLGTPGLQSRPITA
jgi:cellulose synthase/poly-beta-1,6-N-acetylglucosamine synthase-like glycosyltransferase